MTLPLPKKTKTNWPHTRDRIAQMREEMRRIIEDEPEQDLLVIVDSREIGERIEREDRSRRKKYETKPQLAQSRKAAARFVIRLIDQAEHDTDNAILAIMSACVNYGRVKYWGEIAQGTATYHAGAKGGKGGRDRTKPRKASDIPEPIADRDARIKKVADGVRRANPFLSDKDWTVAEKTAARLQSEGLNISPDTVSRTIKKHKISHQRNSRK